MSDRTVTLTRRRLLGGLALIGGASAATGAGTVAYFSDSEGSSGNTVQAGTLDLELDGADQTVTFLDVDGIVPGDSGSQSIDLSNTGTVDGSLELVLTDVRDYENGIVSNENSEDDSPNDGELEEYVEVRALVSGTEIVGWTYVEQLQNLSLPEPYQTGVTIAAETTEPFTVEWRFGDPGDTSVREAQSDSVEIDVTFRLVQEGP